MTSLLIALGLVLVFEGLGPAFAPKAWRNMVAQVAQLPDAQLRRVGGALVVAGGVMVFMLVK
ncbi:DUF2065 domain-containing protein [Vibrio sp. S11_S32]|uniref:DUF2065 domain-containing protein n=1 Tax=Vibrio sp. S11_S32 TaxID=2720225 RepID=UPI0016813EAA|nr:DUF2065 family protein [Vibrio sp. S11_S32]MBD1575243.1 DUF2065 domain-containing protein [Vibrio sp. S11_S32]